MENKMISNQKNLFFAIQIFWSQKFGLKLTLVDIVHQK